MKIDIKQLTIKIRSGDSVNLAKSSLEEDMRTIYDYYDAVEKPSWMKPYYIYHSNFRLIPFASVYLSKLIGQPISITIKQDVVNISPE